MANVITYNQVVELLTDIARRHYQVNTFYLGRNWELENSDDILYPLFQVYPDFGRLPINAYNEYKTQQIRFVCKVIDTTTPGEDNERDVHSDTLRIAQDIVNEFNQHPFYVRSNIKLIEDIDFTPLEEFKDDISAGWQFNLVFQIINLNTFCGMPIAEIPGFSATGPTSQGEIVDVKYLTCDTLTECPSFIDHETRIDALESEESDLEQRVQDLEAIVFYQNELISGGASFLSGLTFAVTDLVYVISGELYTSLATNVTINAGDPTFDRIDLIIADVNGNVSVVEGTPDANPVKPDIDETTQIEVTFINVPAGAVVIPIPITLVYDENTGTPTEWATSTNMPANINFNATNTFYSGTKSIRLTNVPTAKTIVFTNSAPFDTTTQNTIQFAIKNNIAWTTTRRLRFSLQSASGVQIGGLVDIYHGQRGFSSTDITNWQIISIPIAAFAPTTSLISKVVITTYSTSGTLNLNMDYFRLIVGTPTVSAQNTFLTIKDDAGLQTSATTPNDILTVSGGTNLTSVVTAKKVTLNLDPNISLTSAILTGGTANTLTYFNGSKSLSSVTLGSGFSLTSGTLTFTETIPTIAQVLTAGNTMNVNQLIQGNDGSTFIQLQNGFYSEFSNVENGFIFMNDIGTELNHSLRNYFNAPNNEFNGNIVVNTGLVIKSANGGGELSLDAYGGADKVILTIDNSGYDKATLYMEDAYVELSTYSSGGSVNLYTNSGYITVAEAGGFQQNEVELGGETSYLFGKLADGNPSNNSVGILMTKVDTYPLQSAGSFEYIGVAINALNNSIIQVGSLGSTLISTNGSSITGNFSTIIAGSTNILTANNSVILGGTGITGTVDNTVYVPNLIGAGTFNTSTNTADGTTIYSDGSQATLRSDQSTGGYSLIQTEVGNGATLVATDSTGTNANILNILTSGVLITNNGSDNSMLVNDTITSKGLVYYTDYSANFTPESLISKRYVDASIAAINLQSVTDVGSTTTNTIVVTKDTTGFLHKNTDDLEVVVIGSDFTKQGSIQINDALETQSMLLTGTVGIEMASGKVFRSFNGGGELALDAYGNAGNVLLSIDNGGWNKSQLDLEDGYIELSQYDSYGSIFIGTNTHGYVLREPGFSGSLSQIFSSNKTVTLLDDPGFGDGEGMYVGYQSINVREGFGLAIKDNSVAIRTSPIDFNYAIFLGSQNSTIAAGITNTVVIGGSSIAATVSDTVYVPSLNIGTASTDNTATNVLLKDGTNTVVIRTVDSIVGIEAQEYFDAQSGTTVVLAHTPKAGTFPQVFKGGQKLRAGGGRDYTISGATITFNVALVTDDIEVNYKY